MKLEQLANNQIIVYTNDKILFFSYDTLIAEFWKTAKKLYVSAFWDYSRTTSKYLYKFINSLDLDFKVHNKQDFLYRLNKTLDISNIIDVKFQGESM